VGKLYLPEGTSEVDGGSAVFGGLHMTKVINADAFTMGDMQKEIKDAGPRPTVR
jgi:hypothetical protein